MFSWNTENSVLEANVYFVHTRLFAASCMNTARQRDKECHTCEMFSGPGEKMRYLGVKVDIKTCRVVHFNRMS